VRLIDEFVDRGNADTLDPTCLTAIKPPPFFVTPAGPDPKARVSAP
jgi:hypothetical protein